MRHATIRCWALCLLALFPARQASAKELLMLAPQEVSFTASASSPWQKWFPNKIGSNWKSPANYVDGQMHMRCLARELQRKTQLQVCIYWDGKKGKHSCAKSRVQLEQQGDYVAVHSKPADWWGSEPQNWTNIGPKFRILMRDGLALSNIKDWKTYFPLKVNCTIVMVPAGETFSGWAGYPFDNMPTYPPRDGNLPSDCYWGPCDASAGGAVDARSDAREDLGAAPGVADGAVRDAAPGADTGTADRGSPGADIKGRGPVGCAIGEESGGRGGVLPLVLFGLLLAGVSRRGHRPHQRPMPFRFFLDFLLRFRPAMASIIFSNSSKASRQKSPSL